MPTKNKQLQASYARTHYARNKAAVKKRAVEFTRYARRRNADFANRVKRRFGCAKCGMRVPVCLDFHHLYDKVAAIGRAVQKGWSIENLKDEMRKCAILCSNCHRIETFTSCSYN